jgi:tetratricopeptide (TPR) repeat protein
MAYARRARETADVQFYGKAEETLKKSFAIAPDNFEGRKVETWLQLGRHQFASALETANQLHKVSPDDVAVYGYIVDANVELGNYRDAIDAAQWMLNLRPGNVPGLTRAAYLRELHGNLAGARELMQMAYDSVPFSESEDRAWILSQMAHLKLVEGDLSEAEKHASEALATFPDYHDAIGVLAQVRIAQARSVDAVSLLRKRYEAAPRTDDLYALAEAQELAGQHEDAAASFGKFELQARSQSTLADNCNRELVLYYLDHAGEPAKALELAKREVERRHDVFTLDTYAWALAGSGDYEGAKAQLDKALAIGVKDPRLLFHAGVIALHLHQADQAAAYRKDAASRSSREASDVLQTLSDKSKAGGN